MTRLAIRDYRPRFDMPQVVRLIREELAPLSANPVPRETLSTRELTRRLKRGIVFVAATGKTAPPEGFVHVIRMDQVLQVDMLAVDAKRRGSHIGTRLMARAEHYGMQAGCTLSRLYVDESNDRAQRFYARSGYRPTQYLPDLRCYEMMKLLTAYQNPYGLP